METDFLSREQATNIEATIAGLARSKLALDRELHADLRLAEDLGLDSIQLLTLATEVEDHFRIRLDEADEISIETVGDLIAVVERKLGS